MTTLILIGSLVIGIIAALIEYSIKIRDESDGGAS
jgi:hypothetical protein